MDCVYEIPRSALSQSTAPLRIAPRLIAPIISIPPIPGPEFPDESQVEKRYIHFFLDKSTTGFQGMVDWTLWNRVMMQSSHQQPFVRQFVIAIAALIKSFQVPTLTNRSNAQIQDAKSLATLHRRYALGRYNEAIKTFQSQVSKSETKQVLYSTLLIFFFEALLDNRGSALPHLLEGLRLLRSHTSQNLSQHRSYLSKKSSLGLEDELIEAFEHLDLQVCTVFDVRPLDYHNDILDESVEDIKKMPANFYDLSEARKWLNLVMARAHHFLATTWPITETSSLTKDFVSMNAPGLIVATGFNIFSTPHRLAPELASEQLQHKQELNRWSSSFEPVLSRCRSPDFVGSRDFLIATLMRIHVIGTEIVLAGVLFVRETSYDRFFPEFEELLRLAEIIVDAYKKRETKAGPEDMAFSMDLGLTPQLFLIILRCRDSSMRRRVIAILDTWYVEVCWNPRLITQIGQFIMEVEGESSKEDPIPESRRAILSRIAEGSPHAGQNVCLMQVVQKCGGPDGTPLWTEKLAEYVTARKTFTGEVVE